MISADLTGKAVLVTGAGPIGLLAALVAKQHGVAVHVLDRVESGPKPELARALGATYHSGTVAGKLNGVMQATTPQGIRIVKPNLPAP